MKNQFAIKTTMWRWPGDNGWFFITLDKKLWSQIRSRYPRGMVKIEAHLGKSMWHTSLLPHTQSESYLISIKSQVRKKEGIMEGDVVRLKFTII
ncbi:MAG: DUF1905 domain-containing protein [Candidatus Paceibacterota bacterium]